MEAAGRLDLVTPCALLPSGGNLFSLLPRESADEEGAGAGARQPGDGTAEGAEGAPLPGSHEEEVRAQFLDGGDEAPRGIPAAELEMRSGEAHLLRLFPQLVHEGGDPSLQLFAAHRNEVDRRAGAGGDPQRAPRGLHGGRSVAKARDEARETGAPDRALSNDRDVSVGLAGGGGGDMAGSEAGTPGTQADEVGVDRLLELQNGGEGAAPRSLARANEGALRDGRVGGGEHGLAAGLERALLHRAHGGVAAIAYAEEVEGGARPRDLRAEEGGGEGGGRAVDRHQDSIEHKQRMEVRRGKKSPNALVGASDHPKLLGMVNYRKAESWRLHWGALFGGAAIAVSIGWLGELLGGLFFLFTPGESTVWSWIGGLLTVAFWAAAAFAGGFVASRSADRHTRAGGMVYGAVVWGLMGAFGALIFSLLGGTVGLLAGGTAGAARLSLGIGIVSLAAAAVGAIMGGLAGQTEALEALEEEEPTGRRAPRIGRAPTPEGPSDREPPPPIH